MKPSERAKEALRQAKAAIAEPYSWPGGYPLVVIFEDGEMAHPKCCKSEWRRIAASTRSETLPSDGWGIEGVSAFMEGLPEPCALCGEMIESAYGSSEE